MNMLFVVVIMIATTVMMISYDVIHVNNYCRSNCDYDYDSDD